MATRFMRFAYVRVLPMALRSTSQYLSGLAPTSGSGVEPSGEFLFGQIARYGSMKAILFPEAKFSQTQAR